MNSNVFIGCSGFSYSTWKGEFYPLGLPGSKWLTYYANFFNTVEINSSFYKFPTARTLDTWYKKTPHGYKMAVKANRMITHHRRFKNVEDAVKEFYNVAKEGLRDKLGPVLFQMPPTFKYDSANLENLIKNLNADFKNVIEFRHSSWWIPEVYEVLKENNITFCSVSYPGLSEEVIKTASLGYVRIHGNQELFKSTYTEEEIKLWFENIKAANFEELYIYFNNTWFSGAIQNGQFMQELVKQNNPEGEINRS